MLSPWFDASAPGIPSASAPTGPHGRISEPQPCRLLLILSPPRTGSYHLCRLLWHLGYGKPTEYFNVFHAGAWRRFEQRSWSLLGTARRKLKAPVLSLLPGRSLRRGDGIPDPDWLATLVRERFQASKLTGVRFFAAKIQAHQVGRLAASLRRDFAPMARRGLWLPFDRQAPLLLLLFRRDWLRGLVSFHFSLCSGCFDQGRIFSVQLHPLASLGDPAVMLTDLAAYRVHLEWLIDALRETPWPIHCLAFEDLLSHQETVLRWILRTIDSPDRLPADPALQSWLDFRIARDTSPWQEERSRWLHRLRLDFQAHGLHEHAHAQRCSQLVDLLHRRARGWSG
jgi:hypothetical protein